MGTLTDRKTLIVGLGRTGLSCTRFLAAQGISLAVTDSRAQPPGLERLRSRYPDVALYIGEFSSDAFNAAEQLVVSPGVSLREPLIAAAIRRGVPVLGDIELFARHVQVPVIAITGTNGKSTVTSLVAVIAERAGLDVCVGGNLGTPVLDLLMECEEKATQPDLYVLELSSFQLETTYSLNPVAAVVLNVSPDHMDRYESVDEYASIKQRIYHGNGVMIINADDPRVENMRLPSRTCIRFTLGIPHEGEFGVLDIDGTAWLARGSEPLLREDELHISGRHNTSNALAALALGHAIGLSHGVMIEALKDFSGMPHRCQWVAEQDGITWYNDSKATNVGATAATVGGLPGTVVLIAGGDSKGADFGPLRDLVVDRVRAVILLGRDGAAIGAAVKGTVPTVNAVDMRDAVQKARTIAQCGDSVILSPACASFDMYENFEMRGEDFMTQVREALG